MHMHSEMNGLSLSLPLRTWVPLQSQFLVRLLYLILVGVL